jgi:HD-like signal output (HDOD) protein/DNA-binding response OmpR family regulator
MDPICQILVVCSRPSISNSIAYTLERHGIGVVVAQGRDQALEQIQKHHFDMIVAEIHLRTSSGFEVLAQARRVRPLTLRALFVNGPMEEVDTKVLVNQVGPCAIFHDTIEPDRIWHLLAFEGPVSRAVLNQNDDDPMQDNPTIELSKARVRVRDLEKQNHLLSQEIRRLEGGSARSVATPPLLGTAQPAPPTKATSSTPAAPTSPIAESAVPLAGSPFEGIPAVSTTSLRQRPTGFASEIVDELGLMIDDPDVSLPVLPAIGMKVQKLLHDENCSFEQLAEIVELEQGMSARVLQVANSAIYAGLERIRNLQQAVTRLGMRETCNILQALLGAGLFRTTSPQSKRLMEALWLHSVCCAYSNENIARTMHILESDDFFMMGLLHDVGKLLALKFLEDGGRRLKWNIADLGEPMILEIINYTHNDLGKKLMVKWQYSKMFQQVVSQHNDEDHLCDHPESVVVTYFSNLLTRKLGYSLLPYEGNPLNSQDLAEALNMNEGMRLTLESSLREIVDKIRMTYL